MAQLPPGACGKEQTAIEKFMQGISDSTLGDRAKAVNTYREFVATWPADSGKLVGGCNMMQHVQRTTNDKNLCVIIGSRQLDTSEDKRQEPATVNRNDCARQLKSWIVSCGENICGTLLSLNAGVCTSHV